MFKRLKIECYLKNGIVLNDFLYLDGLLHHQLLKEQKGWYNRKELNKCDSIALDFIAKKGDVYLSSFAKYKIKSEKVVSWRKRFEIQRAEKWAYKNKKIYTNMGRHKNYNEAILVKLIEKLKFIILGDEKKIKQIIRRIHFIGKKTSQGYGEIKEWKVIGTKQKGERHFPIIDETKLRNDGKIYFCSYLPPYYGTKKTKCVIRKF